MTNKYPTAVPPGYRAAYVEVYFPNGDSDRYQAGHSTKVQAEVGPGGELHIVFCPQSEFDGALSGTVYPPGLWKTVKYFAQRNHPI